MQYSGPVLAISLFVVLYTIVIPFVNTDARNAINTTFEPAVRTFSRIVFLCGL